MTKFKENLLKRQKLKALLCNYGLSISGGRIIDDSLNLGYYEQLSFRLVPRVDVSDVFLCDEVDFLSKNPALISHLADRYKTYNDFFREQKMHEEQIELLNMKKDAEYNAFLAQQKI